MTFELPIFISAPALVKKLGVIQKIIANIHNSDGNLSADILNDANLLGARQYFTPMMYGTLSIGNTLTLLKYQNIEIARDVGGTAINSSVEQVGVPTDWQNFINIYGQ